MLYSIIIPTFNRAMLLERVVNTVLNQTCKNWELIIVDDGSSDNTEEVIQKYLHNDKIQYIKKENTGAAHSRNVGASYARGEFIACLDSDDELYPTWLEVIHQNMESNTGIFCLGAVLHQLDGKTKNIYPYATKLFGIKEKVAFTCGSLIIRRSVFEAVGGYDIEIKTGLQSELGFRLIRFVKDSNLKITTINDCLVKINVHDGERQRTDWSSLCSDAIRFIEIFRDDFLKWDKEELGNNYGIVAFCNYKMNRRRLSLLYLSKSIRYRPLYVKNYLRIIKYGMF